MNLDFKRKLPIPKEIKEEYPLTTKQKERVEERDRELKEILSGKSEKFLLIIGPCSADNGDSVMEYLHRLKEIEIRVSSKLFIIPRVYTVKPRTITGGYMGMFHQPDPTGKTDMLKGVISIRNLFIQALEGTGFTVADELLYPENHRYFNDILAYVSVGARSVEDQYHRLVASGLNAPVGMKNPTGGNLNVLLNALTSAQSSHDFLYRGWEVHSEGNPYAHAILRGYTDIEGKNHPNYDYETLVKFKDSYLQTDLNNPALIIDTNHANSDKDYLRQPEITLDVLSSRKKDKGLKTLIKGLMIESYLEDGAQDVNGKVFGKSITDGCLGMEKTLDLITRIYENIE